MADCHFIILICHLHRAASENFRSACYLSTVQEKRRKRCEVIVKNGDDIIEN